MDGPYQLVSELFAHTGPVRSICITLDGQIASGCQADSPNARQWSVSYTTGTIEELSDLFPHNHWVTAITFLKPNLNEIYSEVNSPLLEFLDIISYLIS